MATINNNPEEMVDKRTIYEMWADRNPDFEVHYEDEVMRVLTDYGVGAGESSSIKGKVLGAAYEIFILAFFIGLYKDQKEPLVKETKRLGQPLKYWGNLDSKKFRTAYPKIREYMFMASIARTKIDWLTVEKGNETLTPKKAVDMLIDTVEQYANYGFKIIAAKLRDDASYFYKKTSFIDLFMDLVTPPERPSTTDEVEPEDI